MAPPGLLVAERQRALAHMQNRLMQLGQPSDKAQAMASRVEEAAFNKANSKQEYSNFLETSLKKAATALQRQVPAAVQQQVHILQQGMAQQVARGGGTQYSMTQPAAPQMQYMQQPAAAPVGQQQQIYGIQHQQQQVQYSVMQTQPQVQYGVMQAQPQVQMMPQQNQMQYMQAQPQVQQQYARQSQQQYVQQQPVQQQYVQAHPQVHYMQVPPQQQPQQQYVQQQQVAQQQYMQHQAAQPRYMQPQQPYMQQQPLQQHQQPVMEQQQQYISQGRGGGYMVQQYSTAGHPQAHPQQAQRVQQQAMPIPIPQPVPVPQPVQAQVPQQALRPRQLAPSELARLPSFDDPAFSDFAAEFFPSEANNQSASAAPLPQQQHPHFPPQTHQSVADNSKNSGSSQRDVVAAASDSTRRPLQHDPAALQEFMRLHSAFNRPDHRQMAIKNGERMLQLYRDTAKQQPAHAEHMMQRVHRFNMLLRLLMSDKPQSQLSITDAVLKLTIGFLKQLSNFRDMVKRGHPKVTVERASAAAAMGGAGPPSQSAPSPGGGTPSPSGFLAMLEARDSDTMKLPNSLSASGNGTAAVSGTAVGNPAAKSFQQGMPAHPAQPRHALSTAAEAARQQALLRQRRLQEQQKQREAAAVATVPVLPTDALQRLLAVVGQPRSEQDAVAIRGGFRRLLKVLQGAEQKQLAAQTQPVSTPPLPAEAQRLVGRDRAALEAAAAAVGNSKGATGVVTVSSGHGFVWQPEVEGGPPEEPGAKRQRSESSFSPEAEARSYLIGVSRHRSQSAGGAPQQKSELERRLLVDCEDAAAALHGRVVLLVGPDGSNSRSALVTCVPAAACADGNGSETQGGDSDGRVRAEQRWQVLMLRMGRGYPEDAPTAVFPRVGHGDTSAMERQQLLLDAARERFAAAVPQHPARLRQLAEAWLEATQHVIARISSRQQQE